MGMMKLGQIAGTLVLALGLSACVDATMEIEVTSEETAKGIMIVSMDRGFYEMSQASDTGDNDFCDDGSVEIVEDKAICTEVKEGRFDEITFDDSSSESEKLKITSAGPGLVRVAFPTSTMANDFGAGDASDEEAQKMMEAFFAGHYLTLKVSGGDIVESNMEIAEDGQSAQLVIGFMDLVNGEADIPEEAYAVVRQ